MVRAAPPRRHTRGHYGTDVLYLGTSTGLVHFYECGQGLFPPHSNSGEAPTADADAGGAVGPADGTPAAVSTGVFAATSAAPAMVAGSRMGSAAGIASAAAPRTAAVSATERRRGQHSDNPEPLDRTVEQKAEELRDIANNVNVQARREDIAASRACIRARAGNHSSFLVCKSFALHEQ